MHIISLQKICKVIKDKYKIKTKNCFRERTIKMNYYSTRSGCLGTPKTASQVIKQGLAEDSGLFMPESIPTIDMSFIESLCSLSYHERAAKVLSLFLTDYTYEELLDCADKAYNYTFDGFAAPVSMLIGDDLRVLELWHGPTCAFKDMALQIMPRLLSLALKKTNEKRKAHILVATSGDTGKAALEGYKDVDQIKITVFYPEDGVSRMQKRQMATQEGENVKVCAIKGNFDDAQTGVKKIFADTETAKKLDENGMFLSSANSINWGRLAPQVVYYISAYCDLLSAKDIKPGEKIDITVPTGNFGNIFAAYIAKLMGLPVNKLICASNKNNILTDFLNTGVYDRNRAFYTTMSPSMDILISSNLERLLYLIAGPEKTKGYMEKLNKEGKYEVDSEVLSEIKESFCAYFCDEQECADTIRGIFDKYSYLCDTHTAVAIYAAQKFVNNEKTGLKNIVASTASAYKFAADVMKSLGKETEKLEDEEILSALSEYSKTEIPAPLANLFAKPIRFTESIEKDKESMEKVIF